MADIAATLGTGTLLVLQPSTTDPIALRVAPGIRSGCATPDATPPDAVLGPLVAGYSTRWGL